LPSPPLSGGWSLPSWLLPGSKHCLKDLDFNPKFFMKYSG